MAVKNIKYKPLGAKLQTVPGVQYGTGEERMYGSLSNRINQLTNIAVKQVSRDAQLRAAEDAEKYQAFIQEEDGSLTFNDAPQTGTTDYDLAYYKAAQQNARYQIDTLFQEKLQTAFLKNKYDPQSFNAETTDIRDGLLSSIQEKNPAMFNYYKYDFDQKIYAASKNVYANYAKQQEDIASISFRNIVDSGHIESMFEVYRNSPQAAINVGKFINNAFGSYIQHGPSTAFIAGGVSFDADDTRSNLFSAEKMNKELLYARSRFQYHYLSDKFTNQFEHGDINGLVKELSAIRSGEYITKDFFAPMMAEDGSTILGNEETSISQLGFSEEQRNNLADEIYKQVIFETEKLNSLTDKQNQRNKNLLKLESRAIMTDIYNYLDEGMQNRSTEDLIFNKIRQIERQYPTVDAKEITDPLRALLLDKNSGPTDDPVILFEYMKQARDGELDYSEMLYSPKLTRKSKAKIIEKSLNIQLGEEDYTDSGIYKRGMKHITKSEDGIGSFFFGGGDNTKELKGIYSNLHLGLEGEGFNFSRQDVNSNHIGRIIDNLSKTNMLATDKQSFNRLAGAGKEKSDDLKRFENITERIRQERIKLTRATSDEERQPILDRIAEEQEKLKVFDMNKIRAEQKEMETSNIKYVQGRSYYKTGNFVFELNSDTIQDLLMTSEVVPEAEKQRYRELFGE
tara:strand:- start:6750 stop:8792 length:2043 start_codon:yes stop_codon:yes gene_type:complete